MLISILVSFIYIIHFYNSEEKAVKKVISILLIVVLAVSLCSCTTPRNNVAPYYYTVAPFTETSDNSEEVFFANHTTPSDTILSEMYEIFDNLTSFYGIEKDYPNFQVVSSSELQWSDALDITGFYDSSTKTVYVSDSFNRKSIPTIAHEIMHYLSDNGDVYGLMYQKNSYTLGSAITEGITSYFSAQVYPFGNHTSVYEYETHIASLMAIALGEDKLLNAYLASDVESIANDFNLALENIYPMEKINRFAFTPFDIFLNNLDYYTTILSLLSPSLENSLYDALSSYSMDLVNSCEETMMYYCAEKGCVSDYVNETSSFVDSEYIIPWSYCSALPILLKGIATTCD